ncbi:MAG: 30S ribosome-binding factor RbfA [Phycisphaerae bacterium]|nr:30S ribosome-binding factor RbfA [Phycisphaerae bacterium]
MSRPRSNAPSHRREQLAAEMQRVLQNLLARGLNDPRVEGLVTITEVLVTQDLAQAKVMVSVFPEKPGPKVISALRHASGHLRREIGSAIQTIRIPDLVFELDDRLKKQAAVFEALGKVAAEREGEHPPGIPGTGIDSASPPANNAGTSPWSRPPRGPSAPTGDDPATPTR